MKCEGGLECPFLDASTAAVALTSSWGHVKQVKVFPLWSLLRYLQSASKNTIAGIFLFAFASWNGSNESSLYCCFGGGGRWFSHIYFQFASGKRICTSIALWKCAGKACCLLAYFLLIMLSEIPLAIFLRLGWTRTMLKQDKVIKSACNKDGKSWNVVVEFMLARVHSFSCNLIYGAARTGLDSCVIGVGV